MGGGGGDNLSTSTSMGSCKSVVYLKHERTLLHCRMSLNFVVLGIKDLSIETKEDIVIGLLA